MANPEHGYDSSPRLVHSGGRDDLTQLLSEVRTLLSQGGGGGISDGMNERITKLETHFEYVRRDLDDLKAGQADILRTMTDVSSALTKLPTKNDLWAWKIQYTAISLAAVALIVGGIIGGLGWIKP